ncbi:hypothetical protein ACHHV8_08885 [Paenibacillus sp. TAB 01]|uniref:hypothetical protein n=1 Tax=Paenibacillus sp. TAB 01 TaxID=3368988 RepID=UPI0037507CC4
MKSAFIVWSALRLKQLSWAKPLKKQEEVYKRRKMAILTTNANHFFFLSVAWINFNEAIGKTFQGGLFYEKAGCCTFNRCGTAERVQ